MMIPNLRGKRRWGATAVETGLIMIPLTVFLFGVFEYGRLVMDWNLINNAAREGCRYALANNTSSTINSSVQTVVTNCMGNQTGSFSNLTVAVSGTHSGTSTAVNNLLPGDMITVTVTGNYKFMNVIPFVKTSSALSISSSVTMLCEGGT
jgi:Flp pilus assembly protein TadG